MSLCLLSYLLGGVLDRASRYRVALTQSRVRSRAGSSHPCHIILHKCSRPHIWTTIYLFLVVVAVFVFVITISFLRLISTLGNAVYSRLLPSFLLCPSWEQRTPLSYRIFDFGFGGRRLFSCIRFRQFWNNNNKITIIQQQQLHHHSPPPYKNVHNAWKEHQQQQAITAATPSTNTPNTPPPRPARPLKPWDTSTFGRQQGCKTFQTASQIHTTHM